MTVTALWPRSRRERTLAARCLRLAEALRTAVVERDLLRASMSRDTDLLRWLLAESEWHREQTIAWAAASIAERQVPCDYKASPDVQHRLLHETADRYAQARAEIAELHATIARLRPRLVRGEP